MTLPDKQKRLLAELAPLEDAPARLAWLIERARERPLLPAEFRIDSNRVEGCLSKLWFVPEFRDGRCWFRSESDSLFVKASVSASVMGVSEPGPFSFFGPKYDCHFSPSPSIQNHPYEP